METKIKAKVTSRKFLNDNPRPASPAKGLQPQLSSNLVIRPRAKVNSSAAITARKPSVTNTAVIVYAPNKFSSPRPASPFKTAAHRSAQASPIIANFKAKVTVPARPSSALSFIPPSNTDSRQRVFPPPANRDRRGSTSSTLTAPPCPSNPRTAPPPSPPTSWHTSSPPPSAKSNNSPPPSVVGPGGQALIRVKSRVTRIADVHPSSAHPTPSFPSHKPARVASISNLKLRTGLHPISPPACSSPSLSGSFSPISPSTNNLPARSRFATTREVPSAKKPLPSYQPFVADDLEVSYNSNAPPYIPTLTAKVDPSTIALPHQSPPTSTLSFSSSASRSSLSFDTLNSGASRSTAPTLSSKVNGLSNGSASTSDSLGRLSPANLRNGSRRSVDGLGIRTAPISRQSSPSSCDSLEEEMEVVDLEDRREKAEAKSNRKIADLEITNNSLLAINSTLEAAKHRQAKEIRDLRRRLRESRLILPPPAYRAVKSSLDKEEEEEEDEDDEEGDDEAEPPRPEETYNRVKSMLELLLEQGRKALESKPEDHLVSSKGGTKVLSEEEARTWRGDDIDTPETRSVINSRTTAGDDNDVRDEEDADSKSKPKSSKILVLNTLNARLPPSLDSEDEGEASLLEPDLDDLSSTSSLPPIRVTHSS